MDNRLNDFKDEYNNIEIPDDLENLVDKSIKKGKGDYLKNKNRFKKLKIGIAASLLVFSSFTIGVNTSKSFAQNVKEIPVVSKIAKLVSFREFDVKNKYIDAEVNIPSVELESRKLEKKINTTIHRKMKHHLSKAKEKSEKIYEDFINTGGKKDNFHPLIVKIDYDLIYQNEDIISFKVDYFESQASSYQKTYYYTIDLNKQKVITLKDILGNGYIEYVNEKINNQIQKELKENPSKYFKSDGPAKGFESIKANQQFYLNQNGDIVVVFDKYEIAPGSTGQPEFIIK